MNIVLRYADPVYYKPELCVHCDDPISKETEHKFVRVELATTKSVINLHTTCFKVFVRAVQNFQEYFLIKQEDKVRKN